MTATSNDGDTTLRPARAGDGAAVVAAREDLHELLAVAARASALQTAQA